MVRKHGLLMGVVALGLFSLSANADPLYPGDSDKLHINYPGGITSPIFDQVTALEALETPNNLYAITDESLCDPQYVVNGVGTGFALVESIGGPISDIYGVWDLDHDGNPHFGFVSDMEDPAGTIGLIPPLPINILATYLEVAGTHYDGTMFLAPVLRDQGYTAWFQSDGDVPEPASLCLLGLGVVGLLRRRR